MTVVTAGQAVRTSDVQARLDVAALALLATAAVALALEVSYAIGHPDDLQWYRVVSFAYNVIALVVFVVVTRAILRRDPRHSVGWILALILIGGTTVVMANAYTVWALPGSALVTSLQWWFTAPTAILLATALLLFPTGRPPSPRWRWALWVGAGAAVVGVVAAVFAPWPYPPYPNDTYFGENPLAIDALDGAGAAGPVLGLPLVLVGIVSLVVRSRRADGIERDQIKAVGYAGLAVVGVVISAAIGSLTTDLDSSDSPAGEFVVGDLVFMAGMTSVVIAIGVGIIRYRLYQLDRLMSRTLAYAAIIGLLGAGYVIVVVTASATLTGDGPSVPVAAIAAGLVAVAFQPLRARVESWLERWVFGSRAARHEAAIGLVRQLSGTPTRATLLDQIAQALQGSTGARAARASLNTHDGTTITALAGDPGAQEWDPPISLFEGAVVLGELEFSAGDVARSTHVSVQQLIPVATTAMATLRLQIELDALYAETQARNRELAASRRRLIEAADHERAHLQRVVNEQLHPDLGHLRDAVGKLSESGVDVRARCSQLVAVANRLTSQLRSLARGVLPPVLLDHGIVAALRGDLRRLDATVDLDVAPELHNARFGSDVEIAAYLCCRAVLDDARNSRATAVMVRLDLDQCCLSVAVEHRGADRSLDDLGAALKVSCDQVNALGGDVQIVEGASVGLRARLPQSEPSAGERGPESAPARAG